MTVLCSVWDPERARPVLCIERPGGALIPARTDGDAPGDVAELLARRPTAATLDDALGGCERAGEPRWYVADLAAEPAPRAPHLRAPVVPAEVWAAGVTYERSRVARVVESEVADVYDRVYDAPRPELFLKATAARVAGPGAAVGLRDDSSWRVPEPELALVVGHTGQLLGFTLGNDMSCRDIEGENPLYLPQAKVFAGGVSIGPRLLTADEIRDPRALDLNVEIERDGKTLFEAACSTASIRRTFEELVGALRRSNPLPPGVTLLTGTGVVPDDGVSLVDGDVVRVSCDPIGTLANVCRSAPAIDPPPGWSAPTGSAP